MLITCLWLAGALTVFFLVALACLWRRYVPHGKAPSRTVAAAVTMMLGCSVGLSVSYTAFGPWWLTASFAGELKCTLIELIEHCMLLETTMSGLAGRG